ncbi:MAG TPA: nuclear transport factor 2 family protein, partial [Candidatus Cybelea sp.]
LFDAGAILNESPEQIVQRQVNAYNHHDAQVFGETYAQDGVVVRPSAFVRTPAAIAAAYAQLFAANPHLHVEIVDRSVNGATVTDKESLSGFADGTTRTATVTYTVANGAIARAEAQA